jgi:hypothetical protein
MSALVKLIAQARRMISAVLAAVAGAPAADSGLDDLQREQHARLRGAERVAPR